MCSYILPSLPSETDDSVDPVQRSYYYILKTQKDDSLSGYDTYLSDRCDKDTYKGYDVEIHTRRTLNSKSDLYKKLRDCRVYTARVDGIFLGSYNNFTEEGLKYFGDLVEGNPHL